MNGMWESFKRGYLQRYESEPLMVLFLTMMAVMAVIFVITAILTGGLTAFEGVFPNPEVFFTDHFGSMAYSLDHPYTKYNVIYPPLITVLYGILGMFVEPFTVVSEGESLIIAMRNSNMGAITFILIILGTLYILHLVLTKLMKDRYTTLNIELTFILLATSFPVIFAIQRGNCIVMAAVLCLIFLIWHRSESKVVRYLSFVALGVAAGMKIMPAMFAILLIRERRWEDVAACLIIGAALMFIPAAFTDGSVFAFIENAFSYSDTTANTGGHITINDWVYQILGRGDHTGIVSIGVQMMIAAISTIVVVLDKDMKNWKAIAIISIDVALLFGIGSNYIFIYAIIPLLYFLMEEREPTKENLFFLFCFVICLCLIPRSYEMGASPSTIKSLMLLMMLAYLLFEGMRRILKSECGDNMPLSETNM